MAQEVDLFDSDDELIETECLRCGKPSRGSWFDRTGLCLKCLYEYDRKEGVKQIVRVTAIVAWFAGFIVALLFVGGC